MCLGLRGFLYCTTFHLKIGEVPHKPGLLVSHLAFLLVAIYFSLLFITGFPFFVRVYRSQTVESMVRREKTMYEPCCVVEVPSVWSPDQQHQHHLRISLEMQTFRSHPYLLSQELWEWRPAVYLSKPSRAFWCTAKFENYLKERGLLLNSKPSSGTASLKDLRHALLFWTSVCSSVKWKPWTRQHLKVLPFCSYATLVIFSGFALLKFSHTGTEQKTPTSQGIFFFFNNFVVTKLRCLQHTLLPNNNSQLLHSAVYALDTVLSALNLHNTPVTILQMKTKNRGKERLSGLPKVTRLK